MTKIFALLSVLLPTIAHAEPPAEPATESSWYGWEVFVSGASSLAVLAIGGAVDDSTATPILMTLGGTGYALGGPIIHLVHDDGLEALGSFGLNLGMPIVAGVIAGLITQAVGASNSAFSDFELGFIYYGAPVGALAAIVLDGLLLSDDDAPAAASQAGFGLGLAPTRHGFGLSLGGTF